MIFGSMVLLDLNDDRFVNLLHFCLDQIAGRKAIGVCLLFCVVQLSMCLLGCVERVWRHTTWWLFGLQLLCVRICL